MDQNGESDRLEQYLVELANSEAALDDVRARLGSVILLAFGHLREPGSVESLHSRIVQFTVPGDERTFVPLFTSPQALAAAVQRHPEWGAQAILELPGASALGHLTGVTSVLNPWTAGEFHLPT